MQDLDRRQSMVEGLLGPCQKSRKRQGNGRLFFFLDFKLSATKPFVITRLQTLLHWWKANECVRSYQLRTDRVSMT